jgi:hypothetical protein
VLFTNLDDVSNKGLVKGLIMLSHIQDKKLKQNENIISKLKSQNRSEIDKKEKIIQELNDELNGLKTNLKGCMKIFKFINFLILVIGENFNKNTNNRVVQNNKTKMRSSQSSLNSTFR